MGQCRTNTQDNGIPSTAASPVCTNTPQLPAEIAGPGRIYCGETGELRACHTVVTLMEGTAFAPLLHAQLTLEMLIIGSMPTNEST